LAAERRGRACVLLCHARTGQGVLAMTTSIDANPAVEFYFEQRALAMGAIQGLVLAGLGDDQLRQAPGGEQNPIAFLVWHAARSEDIIVNSLIAGLPQVLDDERLRAMRIESRGLGTGMTADEAVTLAARIDLAALRDYWAAVGERSSSVLRDLTADALQEVIAEDRLNSIVADGAHHNPRAPWLDDFFANHTVSWYLSLLNLHLGQHLFGEASSVRRLMGFPVGL
jgi:DinB family protein